MPMVEKLIKELKITTECHYSLGCRWRLPILNVLQSTPGLVMNYMEGQPIKHYMVYMCIDLVIGFLNDVDMHQIGYTLGLREIRLFIARKFKPPARESLVGIQTLVSTTC